MAMRFSDALKRARRIRKVGNDDAGGVGLQLHQLVQKLDAMRSVQLRFGNDSAKFKLSGQADCLVGSAGQVR